MAKDGIPLTPEGLAQLAQIVKEARGSLTKEQFGRKVGLSHVTLWRIETQKAEYIRASSLSILAPYVGYSLEQLIAIGKGEKPQEISMPRTLLTADNILPIIHQLPPAEKRKLREIDLGSMSDGDLLEAMQAVMDEVKKRFSD